MPDTLDFGTLALEELRRETVVLRNDGAEPLALLGAEVRQWIWGGFAVTPPPTPLVLQPGETVTLEVTASFRHNLATAGLLLLRLRCSEAEWTYACLLRARVTDPDSLYRQTDGLWGEALRQRLQHIVSQQAVLPYDSARIVLFLDVENRGGTVECIYTGQTVRVPPMPQPTVFNVEHAWPRSRGASALPPLSDLHHLFPSLAEANEQRSNLPYGIVKQVLWQAGGSRLGTDSGGTLVFEPRDVRKGDLARALFYVALRYGNMTGFLSAPHEALLRQWHALDSVDAWERERTRRVARYQGRANPFVERPHLLERLYSIGGAADFPAFAVPVASDTALVYSGAGTRWSFSCALLNAGWAPLQLRAVELLSAPETVALQAVHADSLIGPGDVGWVRWELTAQQPVEGEIRVRLRFAAGVRPVECRIRLQAPSAVAQPAVPQIVAADVLEISWHAPQGSGVPRLLAYDILGRAVELRAHVARSSDTLSVRLPRDLLPRGIVFFRLEVGRHVLTTWVLNP
jgi:hypothetical protein